MRYTPYIGTCAQVSAKNLTLMSSGELCTNPSSRATAIRRNTSRIFMKARFNTKCPACDDMIRAGREIVKDSQDRWVHKHCADNAEEIP